MKKHLSFILVALLAIALVTGITAQSTTNQEQDVLGVFQKTNFNQVRVTAAVLNMRAGASTSFNVVSTLRSGQVVEVLGRINDWYVIKLDNDMVGCISANFATPVSQPTQPAPAPQQPAQPAPQPTPQPQPAPQPAPQPTQQPAPQPQQPTNNQPQNSIEALRPEERQMIDLVNGERVKHGLKPLIVDMEVTRVARIKSRDLIDNNYFAHQSPTYGSPFDMLRRFGVNFRMAGENLAGNQSVTGAHTALMNSEGHRNNILNPNFTHIGIGIEKGSKYGMMFTQMFITK
jgi:uncharacterized YkwD family protein